MKKRQRYSNGGGPFQFSDIIALDGSNEKGITSTVTTPPYKGASVSSTQHDGKYVSSTFNWERPKTKVSITSNKGGSTSGRVSRSFGKGNKSSIEASVNRPSGGGGSGTYYGITFKRKI